MVSRDFTGKTEDDAIAAALAELELDRDDVSIEIIERSKSGFLGIGASPAVIRVMYEEAKETEDTVEEKAERFISGLLEHMGVEADIELFAGDEGRLNVVLSGNGLGVVIGRRGETLDALQHLTGYAVNRGTQERVHINVDAENYRKKREESLQRLAEKMAAKVIKYRRSMAMEPMNSYERHVIHTVLQDYDGVTTGSTGTEPNRRVVVTYVVGNTNSGGNTKTPVSREWS